MKMVLHPDVLHRSGRSEGYVNVYRKQPGMVSNVVRTFVTPTNPQTAPQQSIRTSFAAASAGWTALSPTLKNACNGLASIYYSEMYDPQTGGTFAWTGQTLYMSACILSIEAGDGVLTTISDGVPPASSGIIGDLAWVDATGVVTMAMTQAEAGSYNYRLRISLPYTDGYAPPLGAIRSPWLSTDRAAAWDAEDASINDLVFQAGASLADWIAEFAAITNGQLLIAEILAASPNTYLPSPMGRNLTSLNVTVT